MIAHCSIPAPRAPKSALRKFRRCGSRCAVCWFFFLRGNIYRWCFARSRPSHPALLAPWQRRCESATAGYHMARVQVEALESESGPLGERQRSRRFSTGRCSNYISSVWDLPLYRRQTPQNPLQSTRIHFVSPSVAPPLSSWCFFFLPLP